MDIWKTRDKGRKILTSDKFTIEDRKQLIEGVCSIYEDGGSPLDILGFIIGYTEGVENNA